MSIIAAGILPDRYPHIPVWRVRVWRILDGILNTAYQYFENNALVWTPLQRWRGTPPVETVAVAPLSDRRLQLLTITRERELLAAYMITTDPDSEWSEWHKWSHPCPPLSKICAAPLSDGRLQVFAITKEEGWLITAKKADIDPASGWTDWENWPYTAQPLSQICAAPLSDGRLQLFALNYFGGMFTAFQKSTSPNSDWTDWSIFPRPITTSTLMSQMSVAPLSDRRLQLWVITKDSLLRTTWKNTKDWDSEWSDWINLPEQPEVPPVDLAAVSTECTTLFVTTADRGTWVRKKISPDASSSWTGWTKWPVIEPEEQIVNWSAPTGLVPSGTCVAFGRLWVGQGSSLVSFDMVSGKAGLSVSRFGSNAVPRFVQPYGDVLAVACDDERLYTVDPGSGAVAFLAHVGTVAWMGSYSGSVYVTGTQGLYRVARPDENIHTPDGPLVGPYGQGNLGGNPSVLDGVVYLPLGNHSRKVVALDATNLNWLWDATADAAVGGAYCSDATLAFSTQQNTVFFYDVSSRKSINQVSLAGTVVGAPIILGNRAYVATAEGLVTVVDYQAGKPTGSYQLSAEPIGNAVPNTNGVLFYRAMSEIIALDTTAEPAAGIVSYKTDASPSIAQYTQGAVFYADRKEASAVRLDEQIHAYYAESKLIRDFDFHESVETPASKPNFQTQIGLFKKDRSPRANQIVRVTSTAPTEVFYQGQWVDLSPDRHLDVETDGVGRLRLGVAAGAVDSTGTFQQGLSAPELLLTSPFMDSSISFVVRPNADLQNNLATIEKHQLRDAKGYDDSYVVNEEYRNTNNDTALTHATAAINETAGMIHGSMKQARKRDAGNRYCDAACDMAVACCVPKGYAGGEVVCSQSYCFDLNIGSSQFRRLSTEDALSAANSFKSGAPEAYVGDFWDDIKTGAAKIVSGVVHAAEKGAQVSGYAIKKGAEGIKQAYDEVLDTLEKGVLYVQGVLNQIATEIQRVVEAVSFLFDWSAILDLHDQIRDQANGALLALENGSAGVSLESFKQTLDELFTTAKREADQMFENAKRELGGRSALVAQSQASNQPNAVVGTSQNDWLLAKFMDNGLPKNGPQAGAMDLAAVWPDFEPGQAAEQLFENFLKELGISVGQDVTNTINRVVKDFQSGPNILVRSLSAVIDIVQGLADAAIDVTKELSKLLIDLLKTVLPAMREFLNGKLDIPYVTDFYRWATGNDLTVLDLMALLAAIPTGFAMKLVTREPAYASGVSPNRPTGLRADKLLDIPGAGLEIAAGFMQAIWGAVNAGMSSACLVKSEIPVPEPGVSPLDKARIGFTLGVCGVARVLLLAALIRNWQESIPSGLAFAGWIFPTLVMFADLIFIRWNKTKNGNRNPDTSSAMTLIAVVFGFAVTLLFEGLSVLTSEQTTDSWLGFGFAASVSLSFLMRGVVYISPQNWKIPGIVVNGLFLAISGGFQVVRGLRKIIPTEAGALA